MNFGLLIRNRKGLNEVISTVLLILLVIIAIIIIWAFVRPSTEEGAKQVSSADDCLRIQLEPTSCTYNACTLPEQNGDNTVGLSLRRNGRGALSDIIVVFGDVEGKTHTVRTSEANFAGTVPGEGEFMLAGFIVGEFAPVEVKLAAVVGDDGYVCPIISRETICTNQPAVAAGRCADLGDPRGVLNIFDYIAFQNEFGGETQTGDFNRDGSWNVHDLLAYCSSFSALDCSSCQNVTTCTY